jgi:hypothetical protein
MSRHAGNSASPREMSASAISSGAPSTVTGFLASHIRSFGVSAPASAAAAGDGESASTPSPSSPLAASLGSRAGGHVASLLMNPCLADVFLVVDQPSTLAPMTGSPTRRDDDGAAAMRSSQAPSPRAESSPDRLASLISNGAPAPLSMSPGASPRSREASTPGSPEPTPTTLPARASHVDPAAAAAAVVKDRIPAHKALLAAASATFASMFTSGMLESADRAEVEVPYSRRIVECILSYIYCCPDRCVEALNGDTAMEVLDAACYYRLEPLKDAAVSAVASRVSAGNVLPVLAAAVRYESDRLREHCIAFIRQHNTDVINSPHWVTLPRDVATLLIRETVISSELNILRACIEWSRDHVARASPDLLLPGRDEERRSAVRSSLKPFLPFVNFTAMSIEEMDEVEASGCVEVDTLYKAFKAHALGGAPACQPRHGGIVLQWGMTDADQFAVSNNHVSKTAANGFTPLTVTAMNKFAAGAHYWYVSVVDLRAKHDCLIGVRTKRMTAPLPRGCVAAFGNADSAPEVEIKFEACCNTVTAIPASMFRVVRGDECPDSVLGPDYSCVLGACVDFNSGCVRFFDHVSKTLLYTVQAITERSITPSSESSSSRSSTPPARHDGLDAVPAWLPAPLPAPLYPCATLYHRTNGGVILSDTTTYLHERAVPAGVAARASAGHDSLMGTPKKSALFAGGNLRSPSQRPAPPARPVAQLTL